MRTISDEAAAFGVDAPQPRNLVTFTVTDADAYEMIFTTQDVWELVTALEYYKSAANGAVSDTAKALLDELRAWAVAEEQRVQGVKEAA